MSLTRLIPEKALPLGYFAGFLVCIALLAAAYYFEYELFLDPCPLCIVQRVVVLAIGLLCLAALFARRTIWPLRIVLLLVLASSVFGIWVADHHVWIQGLPPEDVPSCSVLSLEQMVKTLPFNELLATMLKGNGSCAQVSWTLMSLSMPQWMLVVFSGFALVATLGLIRVWKA